MILAHAPPAHIALPAPDRAARVLRPVRTSGLSSGTMPAAADPARRVSACVRCSASSSSSEPSSAQHASTSCRRRDVVAISTAAIVASVTGAAQAAASRNHDAAVPQSSSARQLWELSAAASSSSAERADLVSPTVLPQLSQSEKQILEYNQRIQRQNGVPRDFPVFVREGFSVKVLADGYQATKDGLIFKDFEEGQGPMPSDGQEVVFHYAAYNESGRRIDSSYQKGQPARTRMGIQGLIPGFELGLQSMHVGGKRRMVVPPELGPPTGPSTFFSAKQCEVFDVELLQIRNCVRRKTLGGFLSDVVCE